MRSDQGAPPRLIRETPSTHGRRVFWITSMVEGLGVSQVFSYPLAGPRFGVADSTGGFVACSGR